MSAFDDEFGLFGDEGGDEERRPTLGARKIGSGESVGDDIEFEDGASPRRRRGRDGEAAERGPASRRRSGESRPTLGDEVLFPRAVELLQFLAKRLVSDPEAVHVEVRTNDRGGVLELEVAPDDLGKVIGRGGRVAQALRTLVRAGAEGRVTVDILDVDEDDDDADEDEETAGEETAGD